MTSRWEGVPLDIIRQQFQYLYHPKEIQAFCGDPYVFEKLCKDENGEIWEYLYRRDLSDEIKIPKNATIMGTYLQELQSLNEIPDLHNGLIYAAKHGYEKVFENIDISHISEDDIVEYLHQSELKGKVTVFKYLIENRPDIKYDLSGLLTYVSLLNRFLIVQYILETYPNLKVEPSLISTVKSKRSHQKIAALLEEYVSSSGQFDPNAKKLSTPKQSKLTSPKIKTKSISKPSKSVSLNNTTTKCSGITKTGKQCCRNAETESQYCFQHKQ